MLVLVAVSQATLESGSCSRQASRMASDTCGTAPAGGGASAPPRAHLPEQLSRVHPGKLPAPGCNPRLATPCRRWLRRAALHCAPGRTACRCSRRRGGRGQRAGRAGGRASVVQAKLALCSGGPAYASLQPGLQAGTGAGRQGCTRRTQPAQLTDGPRSPTLHGRGGTGGTGQAHCPPRRCTQQGCAAPAAWPGQLWPAQAVERPSHRCHCGPPPAWPPARIASSKIDGCRSPEVNRKVCISWGAILVRLKEPRHADRRPAAQVRSSGVRSALWAPQLGCRRAVRPTEWAQGAACCAPAHLAWSSTPNCVETEEGAIGAEFLRRLGSGKGAWRA